MLFLAVDSRTDACVTARVFASNSNAAKVSTNKLKTLLKVFSV